MNEPLIRAEGLSIGWGRVVLLQDLDFDVARGDIFVILGGSGCGKSTLLRNLIGLERPLRGTVAFGAERSLTEGSGPPGFGVMFQSGALFGSMTLAQNVALPLQKWTRLAAGAIDALVRARLAMVGLEGFENHLPSEISGGMKKRAGIARALALEPRLLFLDEPSAGLDPVTAADLDDLILGLNRNLGMTMVIVTHELASIFKIARRCIMLDKKAMGMIAQGDPKELKEKSDDARVLAFFNRRPTKE